MFKKVNGLFLLYKVLGVFIAILFTAISVLAVYCHLIKKRYPLGYKEYVFCYADEYGLERALVFSVIKTESDFNKDAVSNKGAIGLMQIKVQTAKYIASKLGVKEFDLYSAKTNVQFGCYYLRYLIDRFKNVETALVAYNAGEGRVSEWLKNEEYSSDETNLKVVPYSESKNYLRKIKKSFAKYEKLYGKILDKH